MDTLHGRTESASAALWEMNLEDAAAKVSEAKEQV